jgi:hypothetical protein
MTEIAEPYFDEALQSLVVQENDDWIVSVTPMIVNDRVYLTHRSEYPYSATAGFCYDKGGAAVLAAAVWDFENEPAPPGHKKVAFDAR